MSILYSLFGIPRNVREFAQKIKKEGATSATLKTHSLSEYDNGFGGYDVNLYIEAVSGRRVYREKVCHTGSATASMLWDDSSGTILDMLNGWKKILEKEGININQIQGIKSNLIKSTIK